MLPALAAEFLEFQPLGRRLPVLRCRIIPVLAITALQRHNFSRHLSTPKLATLSAKPRFARMPWGRSLRESTSAKNPKESIQGPTLPKHQRSVVCRAISCCSPIATPLRRNGELERRLVFRHLRNDFRNRAGADRVATFTNREPQAFFHRDRRDQFNHEADVVARHHHLCTCRQLRYACHVRRS